MTRRRYWPQTIAPIAAVVVLLLGLSFSAHGQNFPSKLFEVKGGRIQIQGGLLGLRKQVMLFMVIGNETEKPTIWAEIEFRLPETGESLRKSEEIKKGDPKMFRWPVPKVIWDTEYPFTVSVYADNTRTELMGSEQSTFFFASDANRKAFEESRAGLQGGQASVYQGFRELLGESKLSAKVPGTVANSQLQRDITQRLFAEASKYHKECEHRVLKAEGYDAAERSIISSEMGGKALELEQRLRAKGQMWVEKWFVQSCETVNTYEVLQMESGTGTGTNFIVKKLESEK
jgi:hypothetical protein